MLSKIVTTLYLLKPLDDDLVTGIDHWQRPSQPSFTLIAASTLVTMDVLRGPQKQARPGRHSCDPRCCRPC